MHQINVCFVKEEAHGFVSQRSLTPSSPVVYSLARFPRSTPQLEDTVIFHAPKSNDVAIKTNNLCI